MTQTIRAGIIQPDGQLSVEDINAQYPAFNRERFGSADRGAVHDQRLQSGSHLLVRRGRQNQSLSPNAEATALLTQWLAHDDRIMRPGDFLAGTVVITGGFDDDGETVGLSDDTAAEIEEFHRGWHR